MVDVAELPCSICIDDTEASTVKSGGGGDNVTSKSMFMLCSSIPHVPVTVSKYAPRVVEKSTSISKVDVAKSSDGGVT